jgi:hypothetical protein
MPKRENDAPKRAKLRIDREEPSSKKSSTATEDPSRGTPNTENDEPSLAIERSDTEDPSWKKSRTDTDEPMRAN